MTEMGSSSETLWERGAAWIGFSGVGGPLATLSGNRDMLCISFGVQNHPFAKDRIVALRMYRSLLSGSLHIEHAVPLYPRHVKFAFTFGAGSPRFKRIKEQLETLGYAVTEQPTMLARIGERVKSYWMRARLR